MSKPYPLRLPGNEQPLTLLVPQHAFQEAGFTLQRCQLAPLPIELQAKAMRQLDARLQLCEHNITAHAMRGVSGLQLMEALQLNPSGC